MEGARDRPRGLVVGEHLQPYAQTSTLTLRVPARPEALAIVRLVLMSCAAAAGIELDEIFSLSHEVGNAFANLLVERPERRAS